MTTELAVPEKPQRHYTGSQIFPIVAALMFGLSALLWLPVLRATEIPERGDLLLGAAVLLAAFLAGELFPLQIEVRRETLLVSGSEAPMVLGLLLLPAWSVGLTHVAAGALVFVIRRDSWRNVAVNLSFKQFESGDLDLLVRHTLTRSGLPPHLLHLELTETAIIDISPELLQQLSRIRDLGVEIGLDDFGTGYASLTHLRRLPLSFVKIDQSFVQGLGTDGEDERIVAAVVDLAGNLGLRSIAESLNGVVVVMWTGKAYRIQ